MTLIVLCIVIVAGVSIGAAVVAAANPHLRFPALAAIPVTCVVVVGLLFVFNAPAEALPRRCNIALDRSISAQDPKILDRYYDDVRTFLLDECLTARGGEVATITATSASEVAPPVPVDLGAEPGKNQDKASEVAPTTVNDTIVPDVKAMVEESTRDQGGTDILSYFETIDGPSDDGLDHLLLVETDAIHQTPDLDLAHVDLDDGSIDEIIERLRSDHRLPDLKNVRVWMVGTGLGAPAAELSAARRAAIERFWEAYFDATGAELVHYGPSL